MTAPSGKITNYSYDLKARLTAVSDSGGTLSYLDGRTFNAANQILGENFGDSGSSDSMTLTASYNNMLQPWKLSYAVSGGTTLALDYQWGTSVDSNGNVTSADNNGTLRDLIDASNTNLNITYTYDDMGRLQSADEADNNLNGNITLDAYGNRQNEQGSWDEAFPTNATHNQIDNGSASYDGAGRIISGNWGGVSRTLTWDPEGKLLTYSDSSTAQITYTYDAFGRRVMAQQGSTTHYYYYGAGGGAHPIAEYNGSAWQTNIVVQGAVIATVSGTTVTYLAADMLKSTRLTSGGSASGPSTYGPYGNPSTSNPTSSEFGFGGQMQDAGGIDHFWMRSYSPTLGRWLTPDPAGRAAVDPTNPQSWNRYAYVLNNPGTLTDPLGLDDNSPSGKTAPVTPLMSVTGWGEPWGTLQAPTKPLGPTPIDNPGPTNACTDATAACNIPTHPTAGAGYSTSSSVVPPAEKACEAEAAQNYKSAKARALPDAYEGLKVGAVATVIMQIAAGCALGGGTGTILGGLASTFLGGEGAFAGAPVGCITGAVSTVVDGLPQTVVAGLVAAAATYYLVSHDAAEQYAADMKKCSRLG